MDKTLSGDTAAWAGRSGTSNMSIEVAEALEKFFGFLRIELVVFRFSSRVEENAEEDS